jgi:hypothetical protein
MDAVSNLKFLKLLPGAGFRGSGLIDWLSIIIVLGMLFPIEVFFAFQTQIPKKNHNMLIISKSTQENCHTT